MGRKEYARAAILRKKVFSVIERAALESIVGTARSLVDNQDHSIYSAMTEVLPEIERRGIAIQTNNDLVVIYHMVQGKYGGILSPEERQTIIRNRIQENKLSRRIDANACYQEQFNEFLRQTGTCLDDWDNVDEVERYINPQ